MILVSASTNYLPHYLSQSKISVSHTFYSLSPENVTEEQKRSATDQQLKQLERERLVSAGNLLLNFVDIIEARVQTEFLQSLGEIEINSQSGSNSQSEIKSQSEINSQSGSKSLSEASSEDKFVEFLSTITRMYGKSAENLFIQSFQGVADHQVEDQGQQVEDHQVENEGQVEDGEGKSELSFEQRREKNNMLEKGLYVFFYNYCSVCNLYSFLRYSFLRSIVAIDAFSRSFVAVDSFSRSFVAIFFIICNYFLQI